MKTSSSSTSGTRLVTICGLLSNYVQVMSLKASFTLEDGDGESDIAYKYMRRKSNATFRQADKQTLEKIFAFSVAQYE